MLKFLIPAAVASLMMASSAWAIPNANPSTVMQSASGAAAQQVAERKVVKKRVVKKVIRRDRAHRPCLVESRRMDNDLVKRLMWAGLLAGLGALTTIVANRIATMIWQRLFNEDPPE